MSHLAAHTDDFESFNGNDILDGLGDWIATLAQALEVYDDGGNLGFAGQSSGGGEQGSIKEIGAVTGWASWGDDQYAQIDALDLSATYTPGVLVRADVAGDDYEGAHTSGGAVEIAKHDGGSWSNLTTSGSGSISDGDTLCLEAVGDTIELFVNGSSVISTTDSDFPSGSPGIYSYGQSGIPAGDEFEAGRISHLRLDLIRSNRVNRKQRLTPHQVGRLARNNRRI